MKRERKEDRLFEIAQLLKLTHLIGKVTLGAFLYFFRNDSILICTPWGANQFTFQGRAILSLCEPVSLQLVGPMLLFINWCKNTLNSKKRKKKKENRPF